MKRLRKARWSGWFRNLFFLASATAILVDQAFIMPTAQPILVFLGIFLLGCVPALKGDKSEGVNPIVRLIMSMMGVPLPEETKKKGQDDSDKDITNSV